LQYASIDTSISIHISIFRPSLPMDHTDARDALASSLPSRATTASARRRQEREPALALPMCTLCRARCRHSVAEPLLQCPRCNNRSYCTRVCRARDWNVGHAKECMELQPLEMQVRVYICICVYICMRLECRPCRHSAATPYTPVREGKWVY